MQLCKDKVITNYLHLLRAGHLKEMMEMHGYLAYLANDGVDSHGALEPVGNIDQWAPSRVRDAARQAQLRAHVAPSSLDSELQSLPFWSGNLEQLRSLSVPSLEALD